MNMFVDLEQWAANAFENIRLVPPGSGFMHQMKLECTTNVVINSDGWIYPDSLVGTSQHTPLVNGLGVLAFGTVDLIGVLRALIL